jgi:hypothetical protein
MAAGKAPHGIRRPAAMIKRRKAKAIAPCAFYRSGDGSAAQCRSALKSRPEVARQSETTRPKQQNSAIVLIGWASALVCETASVTTFEIAFMATLLIQMEAALLTGAWFPHLFSCREIGFSDATNCFVVSAQEIAADTAVSRAGCRCHDTERGQVWSKFRARLTPAYRVQSSIFSG